MIPYLNAKKEKDREKGRMQPYSKQGCPAYGGDADLWSAGVGEADEKVGDSPPQSNKLFFCASLAEKKVFGI
jgi:hypothetical protein